MTEDLGAALRAFERALVAKIPAHLAENAGWEQIAMPGMLTELGLTETPAVSWFVAATNPSYERATADGWRYCHTDDDPAKPDLLGITYAGPPPRVYLRADVSLPRMIRTLGHELWHVHEFAIGQKADEEDADKFGAQAAARFWAAHYR